MEQIETRDQQYLRILTSGPNGKDDYEEVRYLKDKGYTDSHLRISYMRDSYNQVLDIVWLGPNSNGIDFIDELRTRANLNQAKPVNDKQPNKNTDQEPIRTWNPSQSSLVQIAIGVIILTIFGFVAHFFEINLGIKLK